MSRNYKKELEWERGKYRQLLFKVGIEEAERHRAHLARHGIRPVDWFRHAASLDLVPPEGGGAGDEGIGECAAQKAGAGMQDAFASPEEMAGGGGAAPEAGKAEPRPGRKFRRMPSPDFETVSGWADMHGRGMTYSAIARAAGGYSSAAVKKRIDWYHHVTSGSSSHENDPDGIYAPR